MSSGDENFGDYEENEENDKKKEKQIIKQKIIPKKIEKKIKPSRTESILKRKKLLEKYGTKVKKIEKTSTKKIKKIGNREKIYKLTDTYIPTSEVVKKNIRNFIFKFNGLKQIKIFEDNVCLAPFDLNEAFYLLEEKNKKKKKKEKLKNVVEKNEIVKKKKNVIFNKEIRMEIEKVDLNDGNLNYAESYELYDRVFKEILESKRKKIFFKKKLDHYSELFKTLGEERKEKIEEEKIKKKEEEILKKKKNKSEIKKINFDSMLKSNFMNLDETPNINLNDGDSEDFVFNNNIDSNDHLLNNNNSKKDIVFKFNDFFEKKNKKKLKKSHSDDIFYIINFKKSIRKKRGEPNCLINYCFDFSSDLKDPNIFDYRIPEKKIKENLDKPKKSIKLNLDIYENTSKNMDSFLKNLNYFNTNINLSFFEHSNKEVDFCYRNFPYLDKNDNYTKSVIENYNEKNLLKNSKSNITIIIDSKDKRDRKVDSYQEQLSMQVKKIMRMKLGRKNMMGGLSDEEKLEILIDNDSEIRKLLMIDKAVDFNIENEIIKNKKRKIKKIFHSRIATHFLNHDFVMMPKKVINLYRPDISSKIILDAFFGKKNTWKFQIVKQKNENSLKKKLGLDSEYVNRFGFWKELFPVMKFL